MTTKDISQSARYDRPSFQSQNSTTSIRSVVGSFCVSLLFIFAVIPQLRADPIVFTFSGTGSGYLGETRFNDSPFTFELYGDTINAPRIPGTLSAFEIEGLGSGVFSARMHVLGNVAFGLDEGEPRYSVLLSLSGPELQGYDLQSSFSPVTFARVGEDPLERFSGIPTSLGPLSLFSARDVTFSAVVVPEPSSVALLSLAGVALLVASRSLKKRH